MLCFYLAKPATSGGVGGSNSSGGIAAPVLSQWCLCVCVLSYISSATRLVRLILLEIADNVEAEPELRSPLQRTEHVCVCVNICAVLFALFTLRILRKRVRARGLISISPQRCAAANSTRAAQRRAQFSFKTS